MKYKVNDQVAGAVLTFGASACVLCGIWLKFENLGGGTHAELAKEMNRFTLLLPDTPKGSNAPKVASDKNILPMKISDKRKKETARENDEI